MSHTKEQFDLYCVIMRCLESQPYAGKEFQDKCFRFLDESQGMTQEQREAGWQTLHDEYERLSKPHWDMVFSRCKQRKLVQGELFA